MLMVPLSLISSSVRYTALPSAAAALPASAVLLSLLPHAVSPSANTPVNASAKTLFHSNFFIILFLLFDVSFKYRINLWVGLYLLFHTMSIGKQ